MFCVLPKRDNAKLTKSLRRLFECMAKGKSFGADEIEHFNGGLFDDNDAIDLTQGEITNLLEAADCDWSQVDHARIRPQPPNGDRT